MIPGSKGGSAFCKRVCKRSFDLGSAKNMKKRPDQGGFFMFLRITGAQRAEQSSIKVAKDLLTPTSLDGNIITYFFREIKQFLNIDKKRGREGYGKKRNVSAYKFF